MTITVTTGTVAAGATVITGVVTMNGVITAGDVTITAGIAAGINVKPTSAAIVKAGMTVMTDAAVGVVDQPGEPLALLAPLDGQALHLALPERDQGDLRRGEEAAEQREGEHDEQVDQEVVHRRRPRGGMT